MKISIIVTNYNGAEILEKSIPEIIKYSPEAAEIIVIDDASTDDSVKLVKEFQKTESKLKLIVQPENMGFVNTSNTAIRACVGELVVLLNSDIYPTKNYIKNTLKHFVDPSVFGVGFSEIGNENWARIFWSEGYLQYEPGRSEKTHITAWLSGGSSIVRREYFLKMGGFDKAYSPFYSEDLDLGYRSWKSGYKLLWEPEAKVYHKHESTTSKLSKNFTNYIKERNRLLVVYRNITDKNLLSSNLRGVIFRCLTGPNYIKIIRAALKQHHSHPGQTVFPKITDREIFSLFSHD